MSNDEHGKDKRRSEATSFSKENLGWLVVADNLVSRSPNERQAYDVQAEQAPPDLLQHKSVAPPSPLLPDLISSYNTVEVFGMTVAAIDTRSERCCLLVRARGSTYAHHTRFNGSTASQRTSSTARRRRKGVAP